MHFYFILFRPSKNIPVSSVPYRVLLSTFFVFPKTFSFIFFAILTGFDKYQQGPSGSAESPGGSHPDTEWFCFTGRAKKRAGTIHPKSRVIAPTLFSPAYRYLFTISCISISLCSMSATSLNWVRQRSRFCPSLWILK